MDFEEAKALWSDDKRTVTPSPYATESRYLITGRIDNKHWTAIVTERNEVTRIISVRHAREKEVKTYDQTGD
ncbi:MAG: BrnT family toxin [Coriobacteriales bacterium]|nr:BrnT family toxin [Coriobacteriales bacterium]